jgi:hypothetical protein
MRTGQGLPNTYKQAHDNTACQPCNNHFEKPFLDRVRRERKVERGDVWTKRSEQPKDSTPDSTPRRQTNRNRAYGNGNAQGICRRQHHHRNVFSYEPPQAGKDVYMPQKLATISTYSISTTSSWKKAFGNNKRQKKRDTKARRKHPTPHTKTPEKK